MSPTAAMERSTVAALAAATPDDRDRVVDLVRVACIGVVVLGHWMMAVVRWDDAGLHGRNLLAVAPWTGWLTWVLQVMPLFFVVGGVANAASWRSARRSHRGYPAWLHGRVDRLLRPVGGLVLAWTVALAVAAACGTAPATLHTASRLVAMPVWFLAVYLVVVAATPLMLGLHERFGWRVPVALGLLAATVDLLAGPVGVGWIGWANFGFVWLLAHQLGFSWRDGSLLHRGRAAALALSGLAALVVLTHRLGYPLSMVGGAGDRSNMTPPNLAIVALTLWQTGLVVLARPSLERLASRPRVWRTTIAANGVAMTVYLWHLTALCLASVLLLHSHAFPQPAAATGAWWLLRPLWLVLLAGLLVPLVAMGSRLESAPRPSRSSWSGRAHDAQAAVGTVLAAAGLALTSIAGLPVPGQALLLPGGGPALMLIGVALVRGTLLREFRPPPTVRR